ncbi:MAG: winged helix-turn-helix domain-containing protein [Pseudomonadota bacterium]
MFRLNLFGPFFLADESDREIVLSSKKGRALLAYLATTPGKSRSREEILALLWSDREEAQGRASLRQVLTGLRKDLGEELLRIDRDRVALNAGQIDLIPPDGAEFLAGFHLADPAFAEWLRDERLGYETGGDATTAAPETDYPERPYIAVMPFLNLSGDAEQQYFADGISEDITTELSRIHKFWVISRNSSFAYKDEAYDLKEAGRTLGASYIVTGSVRKAGSKVRVAAQLTDVKQGAQIWAERYDRDLEDIFAVQDDIVASVVSKLDLSLEAAATARAKNRSPNVLRAYDLLLRARSAWWHGRDDDAFEFTRQSVETDPDYAASHAYFSLQHAYQFYSATLGLSQAEIAEKCLFHAEAALALDEADPVVHAYASMAFGFSPLTAKERGLAHIELAVSINPHDCELMLLHAWHLCFAGRLAEALETLERASDLNPLGGYMISECYTDTYYMLGDYRKALNCYSDQADAPYQTKVTFAACFAMLGDHEGLATCLAELDRDKPRHFDIDAFAAAQVSTCMREEDKAKWREGFRRAGVTV